MIDATICFCLNHQAVLHWVLSTTRSIHVRCF